jgi:ABC-2 type transport system permease protein
LWGGGRSLFFFILLGFYSWVIDGNILDYGYAELTIFFDLSPWFFLLFVPALTMNTISEEVDKGTLGLLKSLPISLNQVILAKFSAVYLIVFLTLIPSLLFVKSIGLLGIPLNNFDFSLVLGGYLGLFVLNGCFIGLGILASSLSRRQPVAFLLGLVFNYIFWQGCGLISLDFFDFQSHYTSVSKGLVQVSDLFFFFGFGLFCIGCSQWRIKQLI